MNQGRHSDVNPPDAVVIPVALEPIHGFQCLFCGLCVVAHARNAFMAAISPFLPWSLASQSLASMSTNSAPLSPERPHKFSSSSLECSRNHAFPVCSQVNGCSGPSGLTNIISVRTDEFFYNLGTQLDEPTISIPSTVISSVHAFCPGHLDNVIDPF